MNRILIFGAGGFGREILAQIRENNDVIGFLDNDSKRWGEVVDGIKILGNADVILNVEFDQIILGTMALPIVDQLVNVGVPRTKIITEYVSVRIEARVNFLKDFAKLYDGIDYCVAEGGVFQGDFSKEINAAFPKSECYLFDTFEGFDERDTSYDNEKGYSNIPSGHFGFTSEELVMSRMKYPEKVKIVKGFFPESTKRVNSNNTYIFVNLDFDLFQPTLAGLEYFYPRMVEHGVILVHDYYHMNYKAVPKAIVEFEKRLGRDLVKLPIGDHCSMAIVKVD